MRGVAADDDAAPRLRRFNGVVHECSQTFEQQLRIALHGRQIRRRVHLQANVGGSSLFELGIDQILQQRRRMKARHLIHNVARLQVLKINLKNRKKRKMSTQSHFSEQASSHAAFAFPLACTHCYRLVWLAPYC